RQPRHRTHPSAVVAELDRGAPPSPPAAPGREPPQPGRIPHQYPLVAPAADHPPVRQYRYRQPAPEAVVVAEEPNRFAAGPGRIPHQHPLIDIAADHPTI